MNQDIREGLATGEYMVVIRSEYEKLLEDLAQKQSVAAHAAVDEFVLAEKEAELAKLREKVQTPCRWCKMHQENNMFKFCPDCGRELRTAHPPEAEGEKDKCPTCGMFNNRHKPFCRCGR